jgi:hypothetical protein
MHKIIFKNFVKEKKKLLDENYSISDVYLYELLSNKNIYDSQRISGFVLNLILNIFSIITVIKCKILNINKLNYVIATKNSPTKLDFRAKKVIDKINLNKCINLIRNKDFISSLILFYKYPNVVFYSGIESIFIGFKKKENLNKIIRYKSFHKNILQIRKFFEILFLFLNVKKIIMIDDNRIYPIFLDISKKNSIETFGYMHYKFSKYIVCIYNYEFDNFLVWSDYFKNILFNINKKYKKKSFFYSDVNIHKKITYKEKKTGILYIFDLDFDLEIFKKINNYLDKNKYDLYLKFKPQNYIDIQYKDFCKNNNIIFFESESLDYILKNKEISFFISSISSLLLEATLYGCIPIKIKTSNDFFDDTIKDKVVHALSPSKFSKINLLLEHMIKNRVNIVNGIRKKTWSVALKKNNVDKFCQKFNS